MALKPALITWAPNETGRASGATGYLLIERRAGFAFASRKVRMPLGWTPRTPHRTGGRTPVLLARLTRRPASPQVDMLLAHDAGSQKKEKSMRKRITLLVTALMMALTMSFSGVAFAAIDEGPGRGNPDTNPAGKCPTGQNKDTSPGGLKKCRS